MTWRAALWQLCLCTGLLAFAPLSAQAQLPVPPLSGHVTDQTGTLSTEQQSALERSLADYEARKGTQLAVLMVRSTAPEAIEQYALRVAELWKLGRKKVDDGLVLVVAKEDRAVRIEVGYGLEGAMSDITSKRIISETLLPRFRQGDFYGGITAGMAQIMRVVDGEPLPPPARAPASSSAGFAQYAPFLLFVVLAVGGVLRRVMGRPLGAVVTGGWMGGGRGGGWGGDLGGFRGGGGGFGGGGASGRW